MSSEFVTSILISIKQEFPFSDPFFGAFFSVFGIALVTFLITFFTVLSLIIYFVCRASQMPSKMNSFSRRLPIKERKIIRESLPPECPECDAPLKYHEVKWVGPHQAECPYCGHIVELKMTETYESY